MEVLIARAGDLVAKRVSGAQLVGAARCALGSLLYSSAFEFAAASALRLPPELVEWDLFLEVSCMVASQGPHWCMECCFLVVASGIKKGLRIEPTI